MCDHCDYRVNDNVELSSGTNYSTISWILLYMVMIDSLLIDRENEREREREDWLEA